MYRILMKNGVIQHLVPIIPLDYKVQLVLCSYGKVYSYGNTMMAEGGLFYCFNGTFGMSTKGPNEFFDNFRSGNSLVYGLQVQKGAKKHFYGNLSPAKVVTPSNMGLSSNDYYLIGLQLTFLDPWAILRF